jgi:hypothetical protein
MSAPIRPSLDAIQEHHARRPDMSPVCVRKHPTSPILFMALQSRGVDATLQSMLGIADSSVEVHLPKELAAWAETLKRLYDVRKREREECAEWMQVFRDNKVDLSPGSEAREVWDKIGELIEERCLDRGGWEQGWNADQVDTVRLSVFAKWLSGGLRNNPVALLKYLTTCAANYVRRTQARWQRVKTFCGVGEFNEIRSQNSVTLRNICQRCDGEPARKYGGRKKKETCDEQYMHGLSGGRGFWLCDECYPRVLRGDVLPPRGIVPPRCRKETAHDEELDDVDDIVYTPQTSITDELRGELDKLPPELRDPLTLKLSGVSVREMKALGQLTGAPTLVGDVRGRVDKGLTALEQNERLADLYNSIP